MVIKQLESLLESKKALIRAYDDDMKRAMKRMEEAQKEAEEFLEAINKLKG